jgi:hypothetical protein
LFQITALCIAVKIRISFLLTHSKVFDIIFDKIKISVNIVLDHQDLTHTRHIEEAVSKIQKKWILLEVELLTSELFPIYSHF